jgi:hypothetical protein
MASMVLGDSTLKSITPSVNAPLKYYFILKQAKGQAQKKEKKKKNHVALTYLLSVLACIKDP